MFLITTADQRFWKKEADLLFLGEWCKRFDQKQDWLNLRYQVLPYHWDDRKKLYHDYQYLEQVNEKFLAFLTNRLNCIHHVSYSSRYWRIIIGYWLFQFIEILFDRYYSIKKASESKLVSETWISPENVDKWIPETIFDFIKLYYSDEYNHYIYSRIIQSLNEIPFTTIEVNTPATISRFPNADSSTIKQVKLHLFRFINKHSPASRDQIVFVCPYMGTWDSIRLQLALRQIPFVEAPSEYSISNPIDHTLRSKLKFTNTTNEFETILSWMIADQIPKEYVEGYLQLKNYADSVFPKHPKVIFTANAYHGNTLFQMWAAYQVELGAKLIGTQHGGNYGSGLWSASESHQIRICDRYYTWGWKKQDSPNVIPLATSKLNAISKGIKSNPDGGVLLINNTIPRYSYWMYSAPVGPQMVKYFNDQYRFVRAVSRDVYNALTVRLYPFDSGWNEAHRWKENFPDLRIYQGEKSLYKQLNESRLSIDTFNTTTYLETFSANYPTILFWDPRYWELRPSAIPYFEGLRKVGILHDTPESAAKKVNEVFRDPMSWWSQNAIQRTLEEFNHQFLRTSDNWLVDWKREFLKLLNENQ